MDCHFLLQGIFSTQALNLGLPHFRQILYCLNHQGRSFSREGRHKSPTPSPCSSNLSGLEQASIFPSLSITQLTLCAPLQGSIQDLPCLIDWPTRPFKAAPALPHLPCQVTSASTRHLSKRLLLWEVAPHTSTSTEVMADGRSCLLLDSM